jgi:hypothetical protein
MEIISAELGYRAKMTVLSKTMVRAAGIFSPFIRELAETMYQFEGPFIADASKFEMTFGPIEPTPHPEAVAQTIAWYRGREPGR